MQNIFSVVMILVFIAAPLVGLWTRSKGSGKMFSRPGPRYRAGGVTLLNCAECAGWKLISQLGAVRATSGGIGDFTRILGILDNGDEISSVWWEK